MRKAITGIGAVLALGGALSGQVLAADWAQMGEEFIGEGKSRLFLGMNSKYREKFYNKDGNNDELMEYVGNTEAQATMGINFVSGYIGDTIGLDVSALGRMKLYGDSATDYSLYNYGLKVLKQTDCYYSGSDGKSGQYRCDDFSGASGLTQFNIKGKFGERDKRLDFNTGLGFYSGGLISSSDDDDVIPTSYTGFDINGRWGNTRLDYVFVNGVMTNDDSSVQNVMVMPNYATHYTYDTDENNENRKIDFVHSIGLTQQVGDLRLIAAFADARNYVRRYLVRGDYRLNFNRRDNLLIRAQFYQNHNYGSVWEWQKQTEIEHDEDSRYGSLPDHTQLINYTFAWTTAPWTLAFHHTRIGEGGFNYGMGNVKGILTNEATGNYGSMRRPNGEVWAVENILDFKYSSNPWLKGLKMSYGYHRSNYYNEKEYEDGSLIGDTYEDEHAFNVSYLMRKGPLKGVSFNFKQAFYNDRGHKYHEGKINDTRFDIAYSIRLK